MLKKILVFILTMLIIIVILFLNVRDGIPNINLKTLSDLGKNAKDYYTQEIEKTIFNPPPLIYHANEEDSFLTNEGVLKYTNIQRYDTESLPALFRNKLLDEIAMERLDDMFSGQYFDHVSPQGVGASDVAKVVDYQFITIGENIALGNFKDDQTLVQAWMDSPGHRVNILSEKNTEIGIAVKKGIYEESEVWIGVQIFARPLSDCPKPSKSFEIDNIELQIKSLESSANKLRAEIESFKPKARNDVQNYNRNVDIYNRIVSEINQLVKRQKIMIQDYNNKINTFNECLAQ